MKKQKLTKTTLLQKRSFKKALLVFFLAFLLWNAYAIIPCFFEKEIQPGEIKIFDRNNILIAHLPREDGFFIPLEKELQVKDVEFTHALVETEDKRFFQHFGIDILAKIRAIRSNIHAKKIVSGGSTLTEQWIKNRYFPQQKRTILQKFREAHLAFVLSFLYPKEYILRQYLDTVYLGNNIYGVKSASFVYFGKSDIQTLSHDEISLLLALIRTPSIENIHEKHFATLCAQISQNLYNQESCFEKPLNSFQAINTFPHVNATIQQQYSESKEASLSITTTIDSSLQRQTKNFMEETLVRLTAHNVNNAAVYVFNPATGEILVWQGSRDFFHTKIDGQVNVIEQKQQIGSTIKPLIYLSAFLDGADQNNLIVDLERDFDSFSEKENLFHPVNYALSETGIVTLGEALANSLNVAAVRLFEHQGALDMYHFFLSMGLELDHDITHYGLSLALGSSDISLRNLAEVYGTLARKGEKVATTLVPTTTTTENLFSNTLAEQKAFSSLFSILSSKELRASAFGLESILNTSIPFAVKTGTTQNFRDNWTIGYHPDLVVAVWVGNNDNSPMTDITGVTGAAPLWHRVVEAFIQEGYIKTNAKNFYAYDDPFEQEFFSDTQRHSYCLEDFFIQDIDPEEIKKIADMYNFSDFSLDWCLEKNKEKTTTTPQPTFIQPQEAEIFFIHEDVPRELQKIVVKTTSPVTFIVNGVESEEKKEILFLLPEEGENVVVIKETGEKRVFFVKRRERVE